MTLALIFIIIFVIASAIQRLDRSAAEGTKMSDTITNVAIQEKIKEEWREKLEKEVDALDVPLGGLFDLITSLYDKYNVPIFTYYHENDEKNHNKKRAQAIFQEVADDNKARYEYCEDIGQPFFYLWTNDWTEIKLDNEEIYNTLKNQSYKNYTNRDYSFINKLNRNGCEDQPSAPNKKTSERIKDNYLDDTIHYYFVSLVNQLKKKTLAQIGYVVSYDGKESAWQEAKKSSEFHAEIVKKYPWIYKE